MRRWTLDVGPAVPYFWLHILCYLLSASFSVGLELREDMELAFGVSYVPSPDMPLFAMFVVFFFFLHYYIGSSHIKRTRFFLSC